ncbi:MAG: hypothetical protein D6765_04425, partial [Bacteroidetes bacterium]
MEERLGKGSEADTIRAFSLAAPRLPPILQPKLPSVKNQLCKWIASGFGTGYSPIAPGTVGAALGALLVWLWQWGVVSRLEELWWGEAVW